jgi:hypothetical protein
MTTSETEPSPDAPLSLAVSLFQSGSKGEATLIRFLETQESFMKWLTAAATTSSDTSPSGTITTTKEIWTTLLDLAFQSPTMEKQRLMKQALEGDLTVGPMENLYQLMKEELYACELR